MSISTETIAAPPQSLTILHLGCGRKKTLEAMGIHNLRLQDGSEYGGEVKLLNLDMLPHVKPDVLCEIGKDRIGLPSNSVDVVWAMHVLEHIGRQGEIAEWFKAWSELYRVLKPGGIVKFECPYFSSTWAWADPTHTRAISEMTFLYLNQDAYAAPNTAMPDYRPDFDFVTLNIEITPDHTNEEIRKREAVSFIRGTLQARKPLNPYWERA